MDDISIVQHFDEKLGQIEENFNYRIEALEKQMGDHFGSCRELCLLKIQAVDLTAQKAHTRLDGHKKSIDCLNKDKNRKNGALAVIAAFVAYIWFR